MTRKAVQRSETFGSCAHRERAGLRPSAGTARTVSFAFPNFLASSVFIAVGLLIAPVAQTSSLLPSGVGSAEAWANEAQSGAAVDRRAKAIGATKPAVLSLKDALMHDPGSPVAGDPNGDVTIVAFVDYNCPLCRKSAADLDALMDDDPKIRVIYKDWPILAKSSVKAAKVAIAAGWQGKYAEVHKALMQLGVGPATDADISKAVIASGVDVTRLNRDLDKRDGEIVSLLKRNFQEADALKLKGTPVYLIGPFMTASPLDLPQFKRIVADAREDQAKPADEAIHADDATPVEDAKP